MWRFRIPHDGPNRVDTGLWVEYRPSTPYIEGGFGGRLRMPATNRALGVYSHAGGAFQRMLMDPLRIVAGDAVALRHCTRNLAP